MATVDEILTRQAYAAGDETWTKDNNYPSYTMYAEPEYVPVTNKRIADFNDQVSVKGEQNARFVGFQLSRYDDAIDLTKQNLYIHYQTVYGGSDGVPCNVSWSDNYVRMCWMIPGQATQEPGSIQMMIYATGTDSVGDRTIWKTLPATYTIHDGLEIGGGIPEPDQSWYEQFVAQMEGKVSTAQGYANDAQASKVAAAGSATAATQSADASAQALAENKDYVESQKETFVGYNKRETDTKYANALIGSASGTGRVSVGDAWEAPIPDLEVAGESEQVSTTGAQLLDLSAVSKSAGGAVVNYGNGGYSISGTGAMTASFTASYDLDIKNVLKPGNLILKSELTMPKLYIRIWDGSTLLEEMQGNSTKQITQEMIDNKNIRIECFIYGNTGSTITPGTYYPMLYQDGDGTWEPYTGGKPSPSPEYPQPLDVRVTGANLFDASLLKSATALGIKFTNNGDGSFTVDGTATGYANTSCPISLPSGTYNISGGKNQPKFFVRISKDGLTYTDHLDNFTINGDEAWVRVFIQVNPNMTVNETIWPMLNAGSTALPWQPYQSKAATIQLTAPLYGIGEYRDKIMCRDGEWGIERYWKHTVLDGSISYAEFDKLSLSKEIRPSLTMKEVEGLVSNAICVPWTWSRDEIGICHYGSGNKNQLSIRIPIEANTREYMADHPAEVIYCPENAPTWEPLPAATQSALNALTTFTGTTHINITAGGPEPDVAVEYVQDTRAVIADIMAQINEIRGGTV